MFETISTSVATTFTGDPTRVRLMPPLNEGLQPPSILQLPMQAEAIAQNALEQAGQELPASAVPLRKSPAPSYHQQKQQVELWQGVRAEQMRIYITRSVISLFIIWVLLGLITLVATGNFWLLLSSPTVISYPLLKVLDYYFGSFDKPRSAKKSQR